MTRLSYRIRQNDLQHQDINTRAPDVVIIRYDHRLFQKPHDCMPKGLRSFSAFSTAHHILLASCRKLRTPGKFSGINAPNRRISRYSSIAAVMLGRAVDVSQSLPRNNRISSSQMASSPPANIDDLIKPKLQQQSIGGFAHVRNKTISGYNAPARAQNRGAGPHTYPSSTGSTFQPTNSTSNVKSMDAFKPRKRTSTEMNTGFVATLRSCGTFQDESNTVDLTQEERSYLRFLDKQPRSHYHNMSLIRMTSMMMTSSILILNTQQGFHQAPPINHCIQFRRMSHPLLQYLIQSWLRQTRKVQPVAPYHGHLLL